MFKFTIDLTISNLITYRDLIGINAIGFALVMMSLQGRLKYLVTDAYHNDPFIRAQAYPVVQIINRVSYWGFFFILSVIVQIAGAFDVVKSFAHYMLNLAFLLTSLAFVAFFQAYIKYLVGYRTRDIAIFRWWQS
jgi:hypothetical protein